MLVLERLRDESITFKHEASGDTIVVKVLKSGRKVLIGCTAQDWWDITRSELLDADAAASAECVPDRRSGAGRKPHRPPPGLSRVD